MHAYSHTSTGAGLPLSHADDLLESLWQASIGGPLPDPLDTMPYPIATLRQRLNQDAPPDWLEAAKCIEEGARLQAAGERAGAMREFGAAFAFTAPATACLLHIASTYLAAGEFEHAERWLRRKASEGSDAETELHLAHAIWGSGRYDEALAVCDRLIEQFPLHVAGIDTAALMHTERGNPRKALDACLTLLSAFPAAESLPAALARRAALAAARLRTTLPRPIVEKISALAAISKDDSLIEIARQIEIHTSAMNNWSDLFTDRKMPRHDTALTAMETQILKELLDIEQSAPVIGFKETAALEQYYHVPIVQPHALVVEGGLRPSFKHIAEHAFTASDLSSAGLLATHISIIATGKVTMLSPFGDNVSSSSSIILNYHPSRREYGSVISYYFEGTHPLFVFYATEDNWPVAWYDPVNHLILCYDDVMEEFTAYLQDRVRELRLSCLADASATYRYLSTAKSRSGKPPTLLTGMLDYLSTHLFADLQGLKRFVEQLPNSTIDSLIVAAPEPFGPIEEILPELSDKPIIRDIPDDGVLFNHRLWRDNRMIARITGCMVEQPLSNRLTARAAQLANPAWRQEVDRLSASANAILFLSLRAHNRRWLEPVFAIADIFNRLHAQYPDFAVIFDGHCLGGTLPPQALIDRENEMIAGIVNHLDINIKYLVSAGRTIQDSIYAASSANVHLSAQGTSSTKSVLIAGLPGVVIGPRQFGWTVTAFRSPSPKTITLSDHSVDTEVGNIQSDFQLNTDLVFDSLSDIINGLYL